VERLRWVIAARAFGFASEDDVPPGPGRVAGGAAVGLVGERILRL
jgi:hypothetical protein